MALVVVEWMLRKRCRRPGRPRIRTYPGFVFLKVAIEIVIRHSRSFFALRGRLVIEYFWKNFLAWARKTSVRIIAC